MAPMEKVLQIADRFHEPYCSTAPELEMQLHADGARFRFRARCTEDKAMWLDALAPGA